MNDAVREIVGRLKERLVQLYGERLKGVYLFGSHAREEADAESDIDLLIVLDYVNNYSKEIERTSEMVAELSLACGRSISFVYVAAERWKSEETMFLINVREEAIPA